MKSGIVLFVRLLSLCTFLFLFGSFSIPAREVHFFAVKKAGVRIGKLTAIAAQEGNVTIYTLSSSSSAWLGTRIWVNHFLKCVYEKNKLIRSDIEMNSSKGKYVSWIVSKGDYYQYDIRNVSYTRKGKFYGPIDFSLVKLYFDEPPANRKQVFAENHAKVVKLSGAGSNMISAYVNELPNVYYYSGGELLRADMMNPSFDYSLERIDE